MNGRDEHPSGTPTPAEIQRNLRTMRLSGSITLTVLAVLAVASFFIPHRDNTLTGPGGVSLLAGAAALWIGFSANRDARTRMARIRRAYAVHGEMSRLLRDFRRAYLVILMRLGAIGACGLAVTVWGRGPGLALFFYILGAILTAMSWPTEHKTRLLIRRARELRPREDADSAPGGGNGR